jgi:hypothetical protein
MDILVVMVLEDTLDKLANQHIPHDRHSRLDECVIVIRACIRLIALNPGNPEYIDKIQQALRELAGIARQNGEILTARRLKMIVHHLGPTVALRRRSAQTA